MKHLGRLRLVRTLRKLFPPSGRAYELFDCSMLLLILGLVGYVLTDPPMNTSRALKGPLYFVTENQLGWFMVTAAVIGIVAAYTRWVRVGYVATITACLVMSANFILGLIFTDASARTVISIVLYAWIARRLMRDSSDVR